MCFREKSGRNSSGNGVKERMFDFWRCIREKQDAKEHPAERKIRAVAKRFQARQYRDSGTDENAVRTA